MARKKLKPAPFPVTRALGLIRAETRKWQTPIVTIYSQRRATPFVILVSTIISLRTQDKTTAEASERLFALADSPAAMLRLSPEKIAKAIYPAGFYKTKARTILDVSRTLLAEYGGRVPDDVEELTKLKGVGRKTANLVVTLGYGKPGICVDTHVHRICNRWGYVKTATPDKTETALRAALPGKHWVEINDLLVSFGQNLCKPVSPLCSACLLARFCPRLGVGHSR